MGRLTNELEAGGATSFAEVSSSQDRHEYQRLSRAGREVRE